MPVQLVNFQQREVQLSQVALTALEVTSAEKVLLQTMMPLSVQLKATFVLLETVKEQHVLQVKPQQMELHVLHAQLTISVPLEYHKLDAKQDMLQQEVSEFALTQLLVK